LRQTLKRGGRGVWDRYFDYISRANIGIPHFIINEWNHNVLMTAAFVNEQCNYGKQYNYLISCMQALPTNIFIFFMYTRVMLSIYNAFNSFVLYANASLPPRIPI
jgi:hypothetical protein